MDDNRPGHYVLWKEVAFSRNHIVLSLKKEGVFLGVLPPKDPLEGIEVDLRIARILNYV